MPNVDQCYSPVKSKSQDQIETPIRGNCKIVSLRSYFVVALVPSVMACLAKLGVLLRSIPVQEAIKVPQRRVTGVGLEYCRGVLMYHEKRSRVFFQKEKELGPREDLRSLCMSKKASKVPRRGHMRSWLVVIEFHLVSCWATESVSACGLGI